MTKVKQGVLQSGIAVAAFVVAAILSFAGFYAPPVGVLSESNLYLIAQFLLVTCSLCGVNSIILKALGNHEGNIRYKKSKSAEH